jgi:hypothetical protein
MVKPKGKRPAKKTNSAYLLLFNKYSKVQAVAIMLVLAVVGSFAVFATQAAVFPYDDAGQAKLVAQPQRGLSYDGLRKVKSYAMHPCRGMFEMVGVKDNSGKPVCTHGGDPTPPGITTTTPVDINQKVNSAKAVPQLAAGTDPAAVASVVASSGTPDYTAFSKMPVTHPRCFGDGVAGKRVQLVYAYYGSISQSGKDFVTSAMSTVLAGKLESFMITSSYADGSVRNIRFQHNSACNPTVRFIQLGNLGSTGIGNKVINAVKAAGLTSDDRKYMIWTNYPNADLCGIGSLQNDDRPGTGNYNNTRAAYAVVAQQCWFYGEPHELMHNLGGVQLSAPHTSGGWHCRDEWDVMCYNDNATGSSTVNGKGTYVRCTDPAKEWFYDCGKDDYFNSGTVSSTNYLSKHWNASNSSFLSR